MGRRANRRTDVGIGLSLVAVLVMLPAAQLRAAEPSAVTVIRIDAPASPIQPREIVMLAVRGMREEDYPKAKVEWSPREGVVLLAVKTWAGQAALLFAATTPGKYNITVSVNGWRQSTETAIAEAKAAGIDEALLKELMAVNDKLEARYPYSLGSAVVEVAGTVPPPPPVSDVTKRVAEAAKAVQGDPARVETAKRLAGVYRDISGLVKSGRLTGQAAIAESLRQATDQALNTPALKTAWQPVRDLMGNLWTKLVQEGAADAAYAGLLDAAADGLESS